MTVEVPKLNGYAVLRNAEAGTVVVSKVVAYAVLKPPLSNPNIRPVIITIGT